MGNHPGILCDSAVCGGAVMGRHNIQGIRSGQELNVAGKDDPRKMKKHRQIEGTPFTVTELNAPHRSDAITPNPPPVYEGWMDHWDPMADLERILEEDRKRRARQDDEQWRGNRGI